MRADFLVALLDGFNFDSVGAIGVSLPVVPALGRNSDERGIGTSKTCCIVRGMPLLQSVA